MTYEFLKSLYKDLISMCSEIVIKREDLASAGETVDTVKDFELFLACAGGTRTFYSFPEFDDDILARYMDPAHVIESKTNRNIIPIEYRDQIIADQSTRVLSRFVEKNNYYRTLMGLPPMNDHRWIYVKGKKGIPENIPIHEMTVEQISKLEIYGELAKIQKEYPDREYLKYLGIHAINLIDARLAKPFEILRLGPSTNPRVVDSFKEEYYFARRYVLTNYYNSAEFVNKPLYDPVVGLMMLSLAIRNTLVPDEADYLNYEEILDAILESYGFLTYFKRFPYIYKRRLVLRLDRILKVKGTDGVLVDICKIFSEDDLLANRYYLMKTYAVDKDNVPILSGDVDQDYNLEFVRASIEEHDINTEEEYREGYNNVVDNDYLWQLTPDELREIKSLDFNLMMSKYIDVQSAFDITSLVFEVCCFINLLLYARTNLSKVSVDNVYATGGRCSLFAMLNFLLAAMSKRAHFDGNIIYEPDKIAEIWRFNYGDVEGQIKDIVDKYELQIDVDRTMVEGFKMQLDKPYGNIGAPDALQVYVNNRALFEAILTEMEHTNDIRHYIALHNVKDVLFTSNTEMETFTKSNGDIAQTYADMLWDLEPKLAMKLNSIKDDDDDAMNALIVYILERLEALFNSDELKYLWLNTPTIYGTILSKYIRTAINVFKASSVQLRSINIFFKLGDRDPVHVLDDFCNHKTRRPDDVIHVIDTIHKHKTRFIDEYITVGDKVYTNIE